MIPPEIELHPSAVSEARKAYRWYLDRSASAAGRFKAALEAAIEEIARSPRRWPVYLHGTRFRLLRRFPFVVVYRQLSPNRLQIVAVADGRRRPGYWRRRK